MVPGALSVMTSGTSVMQRLSVDSWDLLGLSVQSVLLTLAVDLVRGTILLCYINVLVPDKNP